MKINVSLKNKGAAKMKAISLYPDDVKALDELKIKYQMTHSSIVQQLIQDAYSALKSNYDNV
jgi:hypothetical protein